MQDEKTQADFPQKENLKKQLHEDGHAEGGGHGGAEMGWLVSYADMMTLLFGLFVILYSLASNKKSDVDETFRQISDKYFRTPSAVNEPQTQTPEEPVTSETTKESTTQTETATTTETPAIPQETTQELSEKIAKQTEKTIAQQKTIEKQKKKIEETTQQATQLQTQVTDLQKQNEELQKKLETPPAPAPTQNFLLVLLTWETERHDLDMTVQTPHGKSFDFKKRKIASEPGEFTLDSRLGPGLEMWRASDFTEGQYQITASLYNQNGNAKPAKAHLTIYTNNGTINLPSFELTSAERKKSFQFSVKKDGSINN